MRAMILAAGYGTRLGILSEQRPKPMLPVGNVPLIVHALELLKRAGITEVAINTHHRGDHLTEYLGDGSAFGVELFWSHEEGDILGTGGGVKKIRDFLGDEPAVICNGKIVTTVDLGEVIAFHRALGALGTMVLKPDPDAGRWGSIGASSDGRLASILGKNARGEEVPAAPTMFTGISVVEPAFIDTLPEGPSCMVRQGWKPLFAAGRPLGGFVMGADDYWWEHSTPARYLEGNRNLFTRDLLGRLPAPIPSGTLPPQITVEPGTFTLLDHHVTAGEKVTFGGMVVVGDHVSIDPGVSLRDCIVWPGTTVTESAEHAVITPRGTLVVETEASGGFTGPALKNRP